MLQLDAMGMDVLEEERLELVGLEVEELEVEGPVLERLGWRGRC